MDMYMYMYIKKDYKVMLRIMIFIFRTFKQGYDIYNIFDENVARM